MQKTDIFILRAASKIAKTQRENEPLAPTNRASRLAVIAELGGPTLKPATKSGIATDRLLVEAVEAAKTARRARRNRRSYPLDPKAARIKEFGTAAPLFPSGDLARRHAATIRKLHLRALRNLNLGVSGSESYAVALTDDFNTVTASSETYKDWNNTYKGSYRGYAKTGLIYKAILPFQWLSRVHRHGLASVDGLPTLDAQEIACSDHGMRIYAATWLRRSKGQSVIVERGFIARSTTINVFFHAATSRAAIIGLRRNLAHHSNTPADLAAKSQQAIAAFCKRWKKSDLIVTLDDAHAIGACNTGIKSWCYAAGLQSYLERGNAPVKALATAYALAPLPKVRKAILYAVKRQKTV